MADNRTLEQMVKDLAKVTRHVKEMTDEEAEALKKTVDYPVKVFIEETRKKK